MRYSLWPLPYSGRRENSNASVKEALSAFDYLPYVFPFCLCQEIQIKNFVVSWIVRVRRIRYDKVELTQHV